MRDWIVAGLKALGAIIVVGGLFLVVALTPPEIFGPILVTIIVLGIFVGLSVMFKGMAEEKRERERRDIRMAQFKAKRPVPQPPQPDNRN